MAVAVAAMAACGPSNAQVDRERAAHAALVDHHLEELRAAHACDAEWDAWKKATQAVLVALKNDSATYADFRREQERTDVRREACARTLPAADQLSRDLLRLTDAWLETCSHCAAAEACQAELTRLRDLQRKDAAAATAALRELRRKPVCGGAGR